MLSFSQTKFKIISFVGILVRFSLITAGNLTLKAEGAQTLEAYGKTVYCASSKAHFCPLNTVEVGWAVGGEEECANTQNKFCELMTGDARVYNSDAKYCYSTVFRNGGTCENQKFTLPADQLLIDFLKQQDGYKDLVGIEAPNECSGDLGGQQRLKIPYIRNIDYVDTQVNIDKIAAAVRLGINIRRGIGLNDSGTRYCSTLNSISVKGATNEAVCYENISKTNENSRPCVYRDSKGSESCLKGLTSNFNDLNPIGYYDISTSQTKIPTPGSYESVDSTCSYLNKNTITDSTNEQICLRFETMNSQGIEDGGQQNSQTFAVDETSFRNFNKNAPAIAPSGISFQNIPNKWLFQLIYEARTSSKGYCLNPSDPGYKYYLATLKAVTLTPLRCIEKTAPEKQESEEVLQSTLGLDIASNFNLCKQNSYDVMKAKSNKGCSDYVKVTLEGSELKYTKLEKYGACVECIYGAGAKTVASYDDETSSGKKTIDLCAENGVSSSECSKFTGQVITPNNEPFAVPRQGYIYSAFGCINTSSQTSIVNTVISIALVFMGGAVVARTLQGALILRKGDPESIKEGREIIIAALMGMLMLIFSAAILNFVAVNVLGLGPSSGFTGIGS